MSATLNKTISAQASINPWSGFRAMVGKEIKQKFNWAILAIIGMAITLTLIARQSLPSVSGQSGMGYGMYYQIWSLVGSAYFIAPFLIALLLGALQIIPEQRRDQWAFLIHRPASRSNLFWGKVTGGLILYILITVLPLLGFAVWTMIPGHMAGPFDVRLLTGALMGILNGGILYFATQLTTLRHARWWGSKLTPLLAGGMMALILFFVTSSNTFMRSWAMLIIIITTLLIFTFATVGSFVSDGHFSKQNPAARFSLCSILYFGIILTWVIVIFIIISGVNLINPSPQNLSNNFPLEYGVTNSGRVVIESYDSIGNLHIAYPFSVGPSDHSTSKRILTDNDFLNFQSVSGPISHEMDANFMTPEHYMIYAFSRNPAEQWFYIRSRREYIGYDKYTRRMCGAFQIPPDIPKHRQGASVHPEPLLNDNYLQSSQSSPILIAFPHALYRLNRSNLTFYRLPLPLGNDIITSLLNLTASDSAPYSPIHNQSSAENFIALTASDIYVLSESNKYLFSMPNLERPSGYSHVMLALTLNGKDIYAWYDYPAGIMDEYSDQGTLVHHYVLPKLRAVSNDDASRRYSLVGLLVPPIFSPIAINFVMENLVTSTEENTNSIHDPWLRLYLVLNVLPAIVSSFLAFLIARRCAYTRYGTWAWTIGAFFLGLPGVLLMLALREWPAREVCHNCHKKRVVTREFCEHCGARWAARVLDGTEIFDGGSIL